MKELSNIAFIVQARLNSERVPRKMIREFHNGKNLLEIVLGKLVASNYIPNHQIYLAVHEQELIDIGEKYPINVFKRSYESANSDVGVSKLFEWWKPLSFSYEYVVMVSGCLPFLKVETIEKFIKDYQETELEGIFSVTEKKNYFWKEGKLINDWPEGNDLLNTKAVEPVYEAGHALYGSRLELIEQGDWVGNWKTFEDIKFHTISEKEAFDIDHEWQFELARHVNPYTYDKL